MKSRSKIYLPAFLLLTAVLQAQIPLTFQKVDVPVYSAKPSGEFQILSLPSSFGSSRVRDLQALDSLKDKKIISVKLVYSKYRFQEGYDQEALNKKRLDQLMAYRPRLFDRDDIRWYSIRQTRGDSSEARSLFHGFSIVYCKKPRRDYAVCERLLNPDSLPVQLFTFKGTEAHTIVGKEGSTLTIRPGTFWDKNKKPYSGEVRVELKEAITMESILLGNMTTLADGNALESGGMIYVDARGKAGEKLQINPAQPIEVSIPSGGSFNNEMQLWDADTSGAFINWKNPKPLSNTRVKNNARPSKNDSAVLQDALSPTLNFARVEGVNYAINGLDFSALEKESILSYSYLNPRIGYYYRLFDRDSIVVYKLSTDKNYRFKVLESLTTTAQSITTKKLSSPSRLPREWRDF